jgi:ribonuclease Y
VKRIDQLETIAKGFDGVQQAYAMQAGREIRVMVIPEKVSDADAVRWRRRCARRLRTK